MTVLLRHRLLGKLNLCELLDSEVYGGTIVAVIVKSFLQECQLTQRCHCKTALSSLSQCCNSINSTYVFTAVAAGHHSEVVLQVHKCLAKNMIALPLSHWSVHTGSVEDVFCLNSDCSDVYNWYSAWASHGIFMYINQHFQSSSFAAALSTCNCHQLLKGSPARSALNQMACYKHFIQWSNIQWTWPIIKNAVKLTNTHNNRYSSKQ